MSARYGRREAEYAFDRLVETLGKRKAASWDDVGGWVLDYNSIYGGYVVEEVVNERGATKHVFGSGRVPARQFCDRVSFALDALWIIEQDKEVSK